MTNVHALPIPGDRALVTARWAIFTAIGAEWPAEHPSASDEELVNAVLRLPEAERQIAENHPEVEQYHYPAVAILAREIAERQGVTVDTLLTAVGA